MSENFLRYLERERDRLEALLAQQQHRALSDEIAIERLNMARFIVQDQLVRWQAEPRESVAA